MKWPINKSRHKLPRPARSVFRMLKPVGHKTTWDIGKRLIVNDQYIISPLRINALSAVSPKPGFAPNVRAV